jgi:hypothetical protein
MKLETKIEALGYVKWYMDLLGVHMVLFGQYSSNFFILRNKIILVCYYNDIGLSEIESLYNSSKLKYFGIGYKQFTDLSKLVIENMN